MAAIRLHTLNHQPVALWQLQGDLTDSSGNGFTMTTESGTARYVPLYPGLLGLHFDGAFRPFVSTAQSLLNILGDMTFECLLDMENGIGTASAIAIASNGAAATGSSTVNYAYLVGMTKNTTALTFTQENGSNAISSFTYSKKAIPYGLCHFGFTRISNIVTIYVNGRSVGSSTALTTPTDGSAGKFRLGSDALFAPACTMASVKVIARGLSAAEMLDEYAQTIGIRFESYSARSNLDISIEDYLVTTDTAATG